MADKTFVALVGMGTVGTGVARLLLDQGDRTARHAGRTLWLNHVVVMNPAKRREMELPGGLLTTDLNRLLNDRSVTIAAHLVGGLEPARSIFLKLLESGKDVVTANKALLAEHGPELFDRARELGRTIAFEASVGGGVPMVVNLSQCFSANRIQSLRGILNGTSNFILTAMDEGGSSYAGALARAQARGFAETDPTMDVDGSDAAQKLSILAHLAFGASTRWRDIARRGIDGLDPADFTFAKNLGYRIKLVASGDLTAGGLHLSVSPRLVRIGTPLAEVRDNYNALSVVGDAVGPVFFHGQGAGQMPTASAVVADMIDIATGRAAITFRNLNWWSSEGPADRIADSKSIASRYYLRFAVPDQPGTLASLAGALGARQVSIASVWQPDSTTPSGQTIPLVILTHLARAGHVAAAVDTIRTMPGGLQVMEQLTILD